MEIYSDPGHSEQLKNNLTAYLNRRWWGTGKSQFIGKRQEAKKKNKEYHVGMTNEKLFTNLKPNQVIQANNVSCRPHKQTHIQPHSSWYCSIHDKYCMCGCLFLQGSVSYSTKVNVNCVCACFTVSGHCHSMIRSCYYNDRMFTTND